MGHQSTRREEPDREILMPHIAEPYPLSGSRRASRPWGSIILFLGPALCFYFAFCSRDAQAGREAMAAHMHVVGTQLLGMVSGATLEGEREPGKEGA